jgi:alpha-ketoglutarate-dependent taurine dioxygenase
VIPEAGGDTVFADSQAAYEALSEPLKALVDGLTAVHDGNRVFANLLDRRDDGLEWEGKSLPRLEPVEHPVVRTHPETGKRNLFVNPNFTSHIAGVSDKESQAILGFLYQHQTQHEFLVRYRWQSGDLGFWDNRTTLHYAVQDYGTEHRVIQRVTIRGDRPS